MKKCIASLLLFCICPFLVTSCFPEADTEEYNGPTYLLTATIENLENPFSVNVIEGEYAEGIYWLVTDHTTIYLDRDGNPIQKSDLAIGDTVSITYNGQVMLSYPAQIFARKIVLK